MNVGFYKYQGTGNDFILIDDRQNQFPLGNVALIEHLCHRRFGIGADGLILLRNHSSSDFEMLYHNSDGKIGSMCGNGGRATVQFAHDLGVIGDKTTFMAADGLHEAYIKDHWVHLKMSDVSGVENNEGFFFMNTGSPHYVAWVENLDDFQVFEEGKKIRYNDRFRQQGTNVNFMEKDGMVLKVRTYERGVEDETFSCGTGVTACAIAASYSGSTSPVQISTKGGDLAVSFERTGDAFRNIYLMGPAKRVFEGTVELSL
ncbi:MAG: diaminopimelate epimerase [Chitinophagaceae bacterium]|nr:diaminopimelate epimerase [Chitinophagaceae bacterium]